MALRAVPDHPKFADLKQRLGTGKAATLGYLECIWHFTARFTPSGNIGKYTDDAIEAWLEWSGDKGHLIKSLSESRWILPHGTFRWVINDWSQYADETVHTTLARDCAIFWDGTIPHSGRLNQAERVRFRDVFCQPEVSRKSAGSQPEVSRKSAYGPEKSATGPIPVPEPVPVPVPDPVPNTPLPPRAPIAVGEFDRWWIVWSETRGTHHKNQAIQAWVSVVTRDNESACFECTASYIASLDDPARGYNPHTFLFEQSPDGFQSRWPVARSNGNGKNGHAKPQSTYVPPAGLITAEKMRELQRERDERTKS